MISLENLTFLTWKVAGLGGNGLRHFLVGHLNLVAPADLREHQSEPVTPFGDGPVLGAQILFALAFIAWVKLAGLTVSFDLPK